MQTFNDCEFDYVLGPYLRLRARKPKIKGGEWDIILMPHITDKSKLIHPWRM